MPRHKTKVRIAAALAFALAATAAAAQYSTPTRNVENPARTPVQETFSLDLPTNIAGTYNVPIVTLPAGQRMVVEYASVRCVGPLAGAPAAVSLTIYQGGGQVEFQLPVRSQGTVALTNDYVHVGSTPVRFYADPIAAGTAVAGTVIRRGTGVETNCVFAVSGHTINI